MNLCNTLCSGAALRTDTIERDFAHRLTQPTTLAINCRTAKRPQIATKDVGQIGFISWSQDGKYLYFDTLQTSTPFFGRVKLGSTQFEPLVDLKNVSRFLGPWGEWNGVTPDGSAVLVRDISTHEIYALSVQWP
jgi:hypothetical protein